MEKGKNRVGLFRALKSTKAVCREQRATEGWQRREGRLARLDQDHCDEGKRSNDRVQNGDGKRCKMSTC